MQWLNPSGAWALLGVIPIIALYMLRKRAKPARVPSLMLWRRTQTSALAARPFQRLKNRLLLWLRLLLVALMTVALMRPAAMSASGGERLFIFDLSASMQTVSDGASRIELAARRAERLMASMRDGDMLTVLCAGASVEQPLVRSTDRAAASAIIGGLKAQNGGADVQGALSLALAMKRDIPSLSITVFSDGYRTANRSISVEAVGQSADNISVSDLRMSEDGAAGFAYARVDNYGAAREATFECYADGVLCDIRTASFEAGETRSVRFELPAGAKEARVRLAESDALSADNERFAVAADKSAETALLASEGNVFLERALSLREGLSVYKTDDAEMTGDYDLYVYDGKLPESLPESGAVLAIAPDREVLGITPGAEESDGAGLRMLSGAAADKVRSGLSFAEIAIRTYRPLTGGDAAIECGGKAVLSLSNSGGRRGAALGFDLHQSNLPLKADFPVLIQNLLSYLLPDARASIGDAECGSVIGLPLNDRAVSARALTPSGREAAISGSTLADSGEIGVYTLVEAFDDGTERSARFTAHMPRAEADTRDVAASVSAEGDSAAEARNASEWTKWALLLWLCVLMVEWGVSRRGVSR